MAPLQTYDDVLHMNLPQDKNMNQRPRPRAVSPIFNNFGDCDSPPSKNLASCSSSSLQAQAQAPIETAILLNTCGVAHYERREYEEARVHFQQAWSVLASTAEAAPGIGGENRRSGGNDAALMQNKRQKKSLDLGLDFGQCQATTILQRTSKVVDITDMDCDSIFDEDDAIATSPSLQQCSSPLNAKPSTTLYIYQRSEYDEGMHTFRDAESVNDADLARHFELVRSTGGAVAELHRSLLLTVVLYNIGQACHQKEWYDDALEHYNGALAQANTYRQSLATCGCDVTCSSSGGASVIGILHNIGQIQYRRGQYEEAMAAYSEALHVARRSAALEGSTERHLDVAATLNCIGVLYFHMPRAETGLAMRHYAEALRIRRGLLRSCASPASQHRDVATTLNNIGRVYYMRGEYDDAMTVYREALGLRRRSLGNDHLDVAATLYNTGQTHHQKGELDEAMALYHEFLRIARARLGDDHRDVAIMVRCVAQIHHEKAEYQKASELYQEALRAGRTALGRDHPEIASTLNKIGNLYYEQGIFDLAMEAYREGLRVERAVLEPDHPNITVTLSNIGQIHKHRGEYDTAMRFYREALRIQKRIFGASHPNVAVTLSSVGMIYYQKGEYARALDLYQEALRLRRDAFGDDHVDVSATLNSIGMVLSKRGLHEMAMQSFMESLRIRRSVLGDNHRDVSIILHNIATIHLHRGDEDTAIQFYKDTLRVERAVLGDDHEDIALTLHHIGHVYQEKGDVDGALHYFEEAMRIERLHAEKTGGDCSTVARTLNSIGNLYLQKGDTKTAIRYYTEASRIYKSAGQGVESLVIVGLNLYTIGLAHPEASAAA